MCLSSKLRSGSFHYIGVAGSGMSALAQFQAMAGGRVSGSDRLFGKDGQKELRKQLEKAGIRVLPQDGSGVADGLDGVVVSTAVEASNPEYALALERKIPVFHRSRVLSAWVESFRTIAVAGSSGKSTVTAMIFEILEGCGLSPSLITGGNLLRLREKGLMGNAFAGTSDILVVETDESDGTLTEYHPYLGVLTNIQKDHKDIPELKALFRKFLSQCKKTVVNGDGQVRATEPDLKESSSSFSVNGVRFWLPLTGRFNVENAVAAIAACGALGVPPEKTAGPLKAFQGVARRFQRVGVKSGVTVIDDFAHNPSKVREALAAAHLKAGRVIAVFQPHGFGPTRFLKDDFIAAFSGSLSKKDVLFMPEIYYAGGTATKDISSRDIVEPLRKKGLNAFYFENRKDIPAEINKIAESGDCVLVMGARDPSLPEFCREILEFRA
jgi:UDP-N-acetylmuramate--alanine ligase